MRDKQRHPEVVLQPVNLHWIQQVIDAPADLCAHGDVEFRIGADVLMDESNGKDLTVSAAALYLLRALSIPHTKENPVGDQLFPCCGFNMWEVEGQEDVVISGCPNGVDFEILHEETGVCICSAEGREWHVDWPSWRDAVFAFADRVSDFYATSSPKEPNDEDRAGFMKFLAEWGRRRGKQLG
jgi:hypothetical protein